MKTAIEQLGKLAEALVFEQREEEKRLASVIEGKSLRIRRAEGVTWSPISVPHHREPMSGARSFL